jgi:hypothetical protein
MFCVLLHRVSLRQRQPLVKKDSLVAAISHGMKGPVGLLRSGQVSFNRTGHIRHQCRKTTVLSCHICLINTGVEKMNTINYKLELGPPDVSTKSKCWYSNNCIV